MTERSESERAELVALEEEFESVCGKTMAATIKRLAAQDQKPVAWLQSSGTKTIVSQQRLDMDASRYGWTEKPLYLSPPPAAGWDQAIEAAKLVVERWSLPTIQTPSMWLIDKAGIVAEIEALRHNAPPDSGAGELETELPPLTCDFAQALPGGKLDDSTYSKIEDALDKIEAPVQDASGKWLSLHERIAAIALPDHGGADAGVGEYLARPSCRCFDERSRELCLDKDRCRPIATALSHQPAPVAANSSAEARLRECLTRVRDQMSEALHTAFRKGSYHEAAVAAHSAIARLPMREWQEIIIFILEGLGVNEALSPHPHASDCDKQGEPTNSEASSHEKRRLDASGEQTSTGPETSISPVRIIAQRHVSAPSANHDVTAGRDRQPSARTSDVTVDELAIFLHDNFLKLGGWKDFARDVLHAFTVWRR